MIPMFLNSVYYKAYLLALLSLNCQYLEVDSLSSIINYEVQDIVKLPDQAIQRKFYYYKYKKTNDLLVFRFRSNDATVYVEFRPDLSMIQRMSYYHVKYMCTLDSSSLYCLNQLLLNNDLNLLKGHNLNVLSSKDKSRQYIVFKKPTQIVCIVVIENSVFKGVINFMN